jgi:CheY-like chemotaxis protein
MTPCILLIEDDADLAGMYTERLKHGGFKVELISNGQVALERLQQADPPDGIILDLMLPGLSGFEIMKYLATDKVRRRIPTIICTAFADDNHEQEAAQLGFTDYFLKTHITPGELTSLMRRRLLTAK